MSEGYNSVSRIYKLKPMGIDISVVHVSIRSCFTSQLVYILKMRLRLVYVMLMLSCPW